MTKADAPTTSVGELSVLLPCWRIDLEAANLPPSTIRTYADDGALFAAFFADKGIPTVAASIRREHVEAFIVAEPGRTAPSSAATRFRLLQQLLVTTMISRLAVPARPSGPRHTPPHRSTRLL